MTLKTRSTVIFLSLIMLGASLGFLCFDRGPDHPRLFYLFAVLVVLVTAATIHLVLFRYMKAIDGARVASENAASRLNLALKAGGFGIWDWDIVRDLLVWDDGMLQIYGIDQSAFNGCLESWKEAIHPEDRERALAATQAALRGETEYDLSFRLLRPDGEIRYIKADGTVIRNGEGAAVRFMGLNADVTEQKIILDSVIRERNKAQLYLDIAGVMFAAIDREGIIRLINKKGGQILGYPEDELIGRNWFEVCLPPTAVGVVKDVFAKQMAGEIESVEFFENPILTRSGEERMIAFHNTLLHEEGGAISGVLFSGEDITERKRAEASLEKAAGEWQAAMDASGDAIYLLDLDRRVLRANKAFYEMTGRSPESSIGMHIAEIIHPGHSAPCILCDAQTALIDFVTVLEAGHPDNHQGCPVEVSLKMVRDGNGKPVSMLVTRHDLSFDRKTQETLRESEERYRQLVEHSQDIIFIKSGGKIVFVNDAGVRILGAASANDILSRRLLDFVHPDSKALVQEHMEMAATQMGRLPVTEVKYQRLDGSTFYGEVTATSIMHQGNAAIHVFVRDITNRKNLEEQLRHSQKLEAVGHLAGGIAHDFNNLLTVIGGYASLLEMKMEPGDPKAEMVDQIVASTDRAANLTRSLLAFSRKQEMHADDCSLNEIVQGVGKFLRRIIGEDITLSTTLGPEPLTVFADKGQIEQVIINLATNARDAMENGGAFSISTGLTVFDGRFIQSRGFGKPGKFAVVKVSDTGKGIDEGVRGKIFEPFFTTKEFGKGTGLGLSIVYGIVKQHKGYIDVDGRPGKGTTFSIYLPLSGNPLPKGRGKETFDAIKRGSETILIAEDEAHVRELVDSVLQQFGYRTMLAVDGRDAVEKFRRHRESIDLVFTDLIMPGKSGMELHTEIKAMRPDVKVLFTSGYMADVMEKHGNVDERYDILMKPIAPAELARKVREMLDA